MYFEDVKCKACIECSKCKDIENVNYPVDIKDVVWALDVVIVNDI